MKKVSGPVAGVGLTLEYHGTMFLVMLTGLYGYTLQHEWAHIATHAYLFTCGLLFWMPLIGRDPAGFRPSRWAKVAMVASGLPAYVALGLLVHAREPERALAENGGGWVLGAGGVALTLARAGAARRSASRQAGRVARALEPTADVGDEQGDEYAAGH